MIDDTKKSATGEDAAHQLLRLVADRPGQLGRVRAARIVAGLKVPTDDSRDDAALASYRCETGWPLRGVVALVDATIAGGLLTLCDGPRPLLVLTRAGFQALDILERVR